MSQIIDQLTLNIKLEDSISLDKFIVCESNKHSLQFIENSLTEDSISNLFYIWGEEGVGKSYLMKAINKEYRKLNKKTFHLSLENSKALSHTILEDLSFMDVMPQTPGHTLVIPKYGTENIFDLPEEYFIHLMDAKQKIAKAIKKDNINPSDRQNKMWIFFFKKRKYFILHIEDSI